MKPAIIYVLFFTCILSGFTAKAQDEKYSKVKIPITSSTVQKFALDNLNLDHFDYEGNNLMAVLNSAELGILKKSGYQYEIVIDDVVQYTLQLNKEAENNPQANLANFAAPCNSVVNLITTPTAFGTGGTLRLGAASGPGYFTYADMSTIMLNLTTTYPGLVTRYTIGNSSAGTPIYGVKISDNAATDEAEPEVLYTALQHAREAISGTSLIFYMQYLLENYASSSEVKRLLDNRELFIIPCINPDGYQFNYGGSSASYPTSGGGLWRKNRRYTGGAASNIGVDLNRNWGIDWGNCAGASTSCGSNVQTDETYYGPSAFSEPETQALRDFVYTRNFNVSIDQHCSGSYYSLPYGRPSLHPVMNTIDSAFYTRIPALMGTYNGFRAGNSPESVAYEVAGGIKDWLLLGNIGTGTKGKIYGMTGEAGGGGFWAPVAQISMLCKEMCFQYLQLALAAGDYYEINDKKDIAVTSTAGKFSFELLRIGQSANAVTVSLIPIENIASVGSPIITTIGTFYGKYTDSISYTLSNPVVSPYRIKYAWKIEAGGTITYDTVTKYYSPTSLLYDDMEGVLSTNWTATSNVADNWAFTTLDKYAGNKSLTESPVGNYTTSTTRTIVYKNSFNLTGALAAQLSFWAKYRAENFRDKLQVQVSTNNSTWTAICGSHTVAESNTTNGGSLGGLPALTGIQDQWTRQLYNLSAYIGSATLYLRFQFTSDNDASAFAFELDQGFYIDDVNVIKSVSLGTLGVKFLNFYGKLLTDKTVQLNWEANVDAMHDHFEVERADANNNFNSIARVNGLLYSAFDYAPQFGSNLYRIKQVDKNGAITYSQVIKINTASSNSSVSIYPNPAKDVINVNISGVGVAKQIIVTDLSGRTLLVRQVSPGTTSANIKIDVSSLSAQTYFIKTVSSKNEITSVQKFVKL
jgi:carboxypeptidase T